jgi:hypothetical protein
MTDTVEPCFAESSALVKRIERPYSMASSLVDD